MANGIIIHQGDPIEVALVHDGVEVGLVETLRVPNIGDIISDDMNMEVWKVISVDTESEPIRAEVEVMELSEIEALIPAN